MRVASLSPKIYSFLGNLCGGSYRRNSGLELDSKIYRKEISAEADRVLTGYCFRRNVVNIFLYVAERSRYYYAADDIPEMLEIFIPLITQEVCWHPHTPGSSILTFHRRI